jgi:KDO2-lipid IV(A) lauroyltransferase
MLQGALLGSILAKFGFRTKVAAANLKLAFPELSEEQRADLLRRHYAHLGILFLEMFRSFFRFDRFVERFSDIEGEEHLRAALAKDKGLFVVSGHLGNWEILTASGPVIFSTGVTMVTKELKPKWLHRAILVTRELIGVKMACEPKTMQGILRALKRKEIVGWVMDQYTGAPVGARVPFFGIPVGSHTALAALALRTGTPVLPAISYRKPNGRFTIRFEPEFQLMEHEDQDTAVILNTANYVKHIEAWVREFPEQWMWIHRRWKGDLSPLAPNSPGEMLR